MSDLTGPIVDRMERDRKRLRELEAQERDMLLLVTALVRKYGEDNGQGKAVVRLTREEAERAHDADLFRWEDPDMNICFGVRK